MIIIFERNFYSDAENIIKVAYDNVIYEEPINEDEKETNSKFYENINNIKIIINENKEYMEVEKAKFDKLMDDDSMMLDNYMVFIFTVNDFNEFINNMDRYMYIYKEGKNIDSFTKKLESDIKLYLNKLSSLNKKNQFESRRASFNNKYNYISIEPIIGKLSRFAAKIQEELYKIHCVINEEDSEKELVFKPDLNKK